MISDKNIDSGKPFDWGLSSKDYAKYRDIYPEEFYRKITDRGLCIKGQKILDVGTGTGVLPRNMYRYGADWTGTDISENQIMQAKRLSEENGMNITYKTGAAEELDFPDGTFDVITACQCWWYFDFSTCAPAFSRMLKKDGRLLILAMEWLPYEDDIAMASEQLVLKYNPKWGGAGETRHKTILPDAAYDYFEEVSQEQFDLKVHFTRESWNGRMKACRGTSASLSETELEAWEKEHKALLERIAPPEFDILHYGSVAEYKLK